MKAETTRPILPLRFFTCVFLSSLFLATTGCGGCGGSSPADKLAKFNLSRSSAPEEETPAPKNKPEPAATAQAEEKPASTDKPVDAKKPTPKSTAPPQPEAEGGTDSSKDAPEVAAAESTPAIPGARDRYVLLEAMKLQPVSGEREQTKARSRAILELVGQAIAQKIEDTGAVFPSAVPDGRDDLLLSWRVHLLPYLGYDELYRQFKLDEPWNSPHNKALIAQKPYPFATPGFEDDRTNLVLMHGAACAAKDREPNPVDSLTDRGLENCVIAIEVADPKARVVWTQPVDLKYSSARPAKAIRGWPDERFLAITADGKVHDWPMLQTAELNRLFAVSNTFDVSTLAAQTEAVPTMAASVSAEKSLTTTTARASLATIASTPLDSEPALAPLPSGQAIEAAKLELRRLFENEIRNASNDAQKSLVARKFLQQTEYLQEDPARHSAALLLAHRFAELSKNPLVAKEALTKLTDRYAFDSLGYSLNVLRLAAENPDRVPPRQMNEFQSLAKAILDTSLDAHNFLAAEEVIRISSSIATSQQDRTTLNRLSMLKEQIKLTRKEFDSIQARYLSLETPSLDLAGNTQVGKYWCLYRDNWEKGFLFLRHSDQDQLQKLAEAEISRPIDPKAKFQIAEGWWEIAQEAPAGLERTRFMGRAARWYKSADDEMTQSIEKVTAQQRLSEFTRLTGVSQIPAI